MWLHIKNQIDKELDKSNLIVNIKNIVSISADKSGLIINIDTTDGHYAETYSVLDEAKQRMFYIMNKVGGNYDDNKKIIDEFYASAGKKNETLKEAISGLHKKLEVVLNSQ